MFRRYFRAPIFTWFLSFMCVKAEGETSKPHKRKTKRNETKKERRVSTTSPSDATGRTKCGAPLKFYAVVDRFRVSGRIRFFDSAAYSTSFRFRRRVFLAEIFT